MELRHLRSFIAVADELNFRRAADKLHLAQPALSAQIKALEDRLNVKLFERTTRSVKLTHAGRVLREEARSVIDVVDRAAHRTRKAEQGLVGTLRLGVIAPAMNPSLANILRDFRKRFPGVQLSIFDLTSPEQIDKLRARELDAGLLRPPIGFPELESHYVEQAEQILALPAGHRLAKKKQLRWTDFDGEHLVLVQPTMQHGYYDAFFASCAKAGATPVATQYANDIETKLWLISAGFGIAPTTSTLARVQRPGLVFRPLPAKLPAVETVLVWRRNDDSPVLTNFRACFSLKSKNSGRSTLSARSQRPEPQTLA
jgi:DNA-binding transcriptional LysR family regulator